jgi:Carboxypeptidase regulatory-like domain
VFFSMANSNTAVANNPHAIPAGQSTPRRPFAEFAAGLVTGKSVDGTVLYEDPASNSTPIFAAPAIVPELAWKTNPQVGHLLGIVSDEAGQPVDGAEVAISSTDGDPASAPGRTSVTTHTDGGGGYGGVDLAPGSYQVTVTPRGQAPYTAPDAVQVTSGQVARLDIKLDRDSPTITVHAQPSGLLLAPVTVAGMAQDPGSGIASVALRVLDAHGNLRLSLEPIDGEGAPSINWTRTTLLEVLSHPNPAGQTYTVEATATDRAGNTRTASVTITVTHQPP